MYLPVFAYPCLFFFLDVVQDFKVSYPELFTQLVMTLLAASSTVCFFLVKMLLKKMKDEKEAMSVRMSVDEQKHDDRHEAIMNAFNELKFKMGILETHQNNMIETIRRHEKELEKLRA